MKNDDMKALSNEVTSSPPRGLVLELPNSKISSPKSNKKEGENFEDIYLLNYFPQSSRSDITDEDAVLHASLLSSIEKSLSSRQLSPMQKKHRTNLSEPGSPDRRTEELQRNFESPQVLEKAELNLTTIDEASKRFENETPRRRTESWSKTQSLGPGGRAHLLMSVSAPLSGGATLIDMILEGESSNPTATAPVMSSEGERRRPGHRKTRRSPGSGSG